MIEVREMREVMDAEATKTAIIDAYCGGNVNTADIAEEMDIDESYVRNTINDFLEEIERAEIEDEMNRIEEEDRERRARDRERRNIRARERQHQMDVVDELLHSDDANDRQMANDILIDICSYSVY